MNSIGSRSSLNGISVWKSRVEYDIFKENIVRSKSRAREGGGSSYNMEIWIAQPEQKLLQGRGLAQCWTVEKYPSNVHGRKILLTGPLTLRAGIELGAWAWMEEVEAETLERVGRGEHKALDEL